MLLTLILYTYTVVMIEAQAMSKYINRAAALQPLNEVEG